MNEMFGDNKLIIQWTTTRGLESHHWEIPLAPLFLLGYVMFVVGVNMLNKAGKR